MNKLLVIIITALLIVPNFVYAQTPREASGTTITQTRTNYANIGLMGLNTTGNPGVLFMRAVSLSTDTVYDAPEWAFWVDANGDFCMASEVSTINYPDFPNGDFNNIECTKVGTQS